MKGLDDHLHGKSEHTVALFLHFVAEYKKLGDIHIHPTKSMIAIGAKKNVAYVTRLGKDFVDVVFPFDRPYNDNLCFKKIAQVPGQQQYNHHLRLMRTEDVNKEVKKFMKMALSFD